MTNLDLLLGNLLVNLILVSIQIAVGLLIFYALGFNPFFNSIGSYIIGLILNTLVIGLFINGLALALTSVLKTPEAAGGGVWIVLIPMMMFSGVFFPLELMSPALAAAFAWLPTRMAVLCFQAIFVEGLSVLSTKFLTNFFGQLGAGLGLFALGLWLFGKFSSTSPSELRRKKKIPPILVTNSSENII
jgi:ABC-type polysaccharide/polyol phosphate export permease